MIHEHGNQEAGGLLEKKKVQEIKAVNLKAMLQAMLQAMLEVMPQAMLEVMLKVMGRFN